MDHTALEAAWQALAVMMDPWRMLLLGCGVILGLIVGILPGIGALAGTALLLPLTFGMDPYAAFALLLGLGSVTATGDSIPAILFGVPGTSGSAATVLDGLPMTKRGEAGRALAASYMASLLGGLFGAFLLALAIPVMRPMMLFIGAPQLLAFSVLGLSMVAALSGNAPLKGLAIASFGLMISMVGADPHTGTFRWTFDTFYLWEGVPLMPIVLGLFALPELADLMVTRQAITNAAEQNQSKIAAMTQGVRDVLRHWWLVIRCSSLGALLGALPGVSGSVIDWIAYGHALKTEKGAAKTFGTGDVRGVIASESANNAREGGTLVPTIAFGVPGSATMALLLGAFMMHGLMPGPEMLTQNLHITYSMVWSIAIANILGAGLCFAFSGQFAKLATLRYTLILPSVLSVVFIGAYQGSSSWGDLLALLIFGVIGWLMKALRWPRAPLILGIVLGAIVERYLFISIGRYGASWLLDPIVLVLLLLSALIVFLPLVRDFRREGGISGMLRHRHRPVLRLPQAFTLALMLTLAYMIYASLDWPENARLVPLVVGTLGLIMALFSLLNELMPTDTVRRSAAGVATGEDTRIHMDIVTDTAHMTARTVAWRVASFVAWILGMMASTALIGLLLTIPLFVTAFMRLQAREKWRLVLPYMVITTLFIYLLFEVALSIHWPRSMLGNLFPDLRLDYRFL